MAKKIEWYGSIPDEAKSWLTFSDQSEKGYEYNKYFTEITASTDDNGGSINDAIGFNIAKNNTLQPRYATVLFRQKWDKKAYCKVTQKGVRPPVIDYETLKLSVTPEKEDIKWNVTSYTFSAVANYENVVYWYIDENDPKDKEHEVSRTPTSVTVTNDSDCHWTSNPSVVNVGKGNFTFKSNTSTSSKTITVSATYTKDGHSVSADGSVIQGLSDEPQYQGDAYIGDKSYLEVTPDGGNIGYDVKEYQFSAVLHAKYARKYIIPLQGTEVKVDDDYGKNNGLNTDKNVTTDCNWEVVSSKSIDPTNISVEKGLAKFNENLDDKSTRGIYVKATYSKDGLTKSDEGNISQGTGVRTYQLEVYPVNLNWKADELNKQEFTVKSTFNNNYRFDYTIPTLTNFNYQLKTKNGIIDTYEIWPKNENASKNLVSENLNVIQNENKNEKSLTLNQLGVDMTPPFDYIVLTYNWTDADGKDFDTATHVEGTKISNLDNKYVGFSFDTSSISGKTGVYLQHGGDNTLSGAECVMINMKEIMNDCGDIESFDVYVAGNWFGDRGEGNVTCEMTLYEGGTMKGPENFIFTNVGGKEVDKRSLKKNVFSKGTYISGSGNNIDYAKAFYTTVAKITYYVKTKTANITEDNTNNGALIHRIYVYPSNPQFIDAGGYKSRDTLQFKVGGEFTEDKEEERVLPISEANINGPTPLDCKINNVTVINNMLSYDIEIFPNTEKIDKTFNISFKVKAKLYEGGTEFDKILDRTYYQKPKA